MPRLLFVLTITAVFLLSTHVYAANGITYHGRIVKPDNTPLESATTRFRIQIKAPDTGNCVLWEEEQTRNMVSSNGTFAITIGDSTDTTISYLRVDTYGWGLERVFSNRSQFSTLTGCTVGNSYLPNPADGRILEVSFKEVPSDPTWEAFPATKVNLIPMALNSLQLEGYRADEFLKIDPYMGQTPVTNAGVNTLLGLIAGTSTLYSKPADPLGGDLTGTIGAGTVVGLRGRALGVAIPAVGQVLKFDGTSWVPSADDTGGAPADASYAAKGIVQFDTSAAVSGVTVTAGVARLADTIVASGPTGGVSTIPVITYDAKGRLTAVTTAAVNDMTKLPLAGGTMTGPINMGLQNITNATSIAATNFSGRNLLLNDNDTNIATVRAPVNLVADYTLTLPTAAPTNGYVLSTDGTGQLSWIAAATGSVTSVTATAPVLSTAGTTPVISLDTGLLANKVPQVGGTALGANGVVVANGTATALTSLNCAVNQVIKFDASGFAACGADSDTGATGFQNGGNSFGAAANLGTNDNFDLNLETNGLTRMTILPSGNVGIGTTTPAVALDVVGQINVTSSAATPAISANSSAGYGLYGATSSAGASGVYGIASAGSGNGVNGFASTATGVYGQTSSGVAVYGIAMSGIGGRFQSATGPGLVVETGNVGIGTVVPGAPLTISATTLDSGTGAVFLMQNTVAGNAGGDTYQVLKSQSGNTAYIYQRNATGLAGFSAVNGFSVDIYGGSNSVGIFKNSGDVALGGTITSATTYAGSKVLIDGVTGNVGIGTTSPNTTLDISGAISQRGMAAPAISLAGQGRIYFDSTSNKFQVSQNGGAYADLIGTGGVAGSGTTNSIPRFTASTTLGDSAISDNGSLVSSTRSISVASGQNFQINGSRVLGVHNTNSLAVGPGANNASTNNGNTAIGFNAHNINVTGGENTAVGYLAGSALQSGSQRNAILGSQAMSANTTGGNDNVAIGYYSGPSSGNANSTWNVFVGSEAGINTSGGLANTFVGRNAGTTTALTSLLNATAIGSNSRVDANNSLVLGDSNVNVGIASVTSPTSRLDFQGAMTVRSMVAPAVSAAGQGRIYFDSTSNKFRASQNGGAYTDLVTSLGGFNANQAIIANGSGVASSFTCSTGQVLGFDASGFAVCTNVTGTGGFVNTGNSYGAVATLGTNDNFALNFETNGTDKMTVLANGNVGIGAISPTEKLHIEGTSSQSLLLKATGIGNHANLKLEPGASTGRALISSGATGASFFFQTGVNYPLQIDSTNFGLSVGSGVGYAQTANSAPANGMIVQGSVGIGTTAPGAKLQTNTSSIGTIGQIIKWGQAGQTANLLELQNNTGTVLSRIDKDGKFYGDGSGLTGVIASVTSDANNNTKAGTGSLNALAAGGNDNTAYGYNSLSNLTTGDNNVAVGRTAGSAISSGQNNIALGMYSMGGGDINSAVSIGTNAMGVASSSYSVAIGEYAMYNGASGSSVAVGFRTLEAAGSGALLNTAVGSYALQGLTTGDNNTALGNMAGQTSTPANEVTTGSNNTFIGYDSGPGTATQLSNATAIGANARVTTSNSLILGSGANVGIGTNSPANPISVVSPTDNSTIASFGNAINSAKVEVQSMGAGQSQKLVFTGTSSSQILSISPTSGSSNMMNIDNKGEGILFSSGSFGNNTTLFGIFDFRANNSSTGMNASSGIQSYMRVEPKVDQSGTAGYTGLLVNATQTSTGSGTKNLIDLQLAGTSQFRVTNDGFVYNNGQIVSLGAGTFYGPLAAQTMVSAMNLGIANGTVSEFNIFGYNAGYAAFKKWSSVATEVIDNSANAEKADMKFNVLDNGTFSEKMRITNTGNVGIGAASPQAALDVVSTGTSSAVIVPRATTGNRPTTLVNGMIRYNTTTTLFEFYQNGVWVNYTTVSDGRLKTNVEPVTDGLKLVNQLNPVFYDWDQSNPKTSGFEDRHQVGFIAQEVEKVLPEVVNKGEDGYRSLEYGKMVSVVIAAVKELYIKALGIDRELASIKAEKADKAEVSQLKSENEKLKKENTAIKAYLCAKDPKAAICK